ncbi:MAG: hypothetical protein ACTSPB_04590, partial [Candidatus Thorarchaeota archaeon]
MNVLSAVYAMVTLVIILAVLWYLRGVFEPRIELPGELGSLRIEKIDYGIYDFDGEQREGLIIEFKREPSEHNLENVYLRLMYTLLSGERDEYMDLNSDECVRTGNIVKCPKELDFEYNVVVNTLLLDTNYKKPNGDSCNLLEADPDEFMYDEDCRNGVLDVYSFKVATQLSEKEYILNLLTLASANQLQEGKNKACCKIDLRNMLGELTKDDVKNEVISNPSVQEEWKKIYDNDITESDVKTHFGDRVTSGDDFIYVNYQDGVEFCSLTNVENCNCKEDLVWGGDVITESCDGWREVEEQILKDIKNAGIAQANYENNVCCVIPLPADENLKTFGFDQKSTFGVSNADIIFKDKIKDYMSALYESEYGYERTEVFLGSDVWGREYLSSDDTKVYVNRVDDQPLLSLSKDKVLKICNTNRINECKCKAWLSGEEMMRECNPSSVEPPTELLNNIYLASYNQYIESVDNDLNHHENKNHRCCKIDVSGLGSYSMNKDTLKNNIVSYMSSSERPLSITISTNDVHTSLGDGFLSGDDDEVYINYMDNIEVCNKANKGACN